MAAPKFPELEEKILKEWKEKEVFKKTLQKPAPAGSFVFYEGPPTANGKPGIHHLLARAFKDIIPRYKTMRGFKVERKAGWDTHGLPVEIEAEKQLGLKSKPEIEAYGIAAFNKKCRESVWMYKDEWERFTERSGFWLDLEHPYITYEASYMETLWWITKKINDRGLLYEDYKVVPHCPRCGTTLSSHELAQGYEDVDDTSVFVRFKLRVSSFELRVPETYFLVWTTTPWTLPGNVVLAVGKDLKYVEVEMPGGEHFILAEARLSALKEEYKTVREFKGSELVGVSYEPIFSFVQYEGKSHMVVEGDFVSTEDGSGIVHIAPMYGADDFEVGTREGLPKVHVVNERGEFLPVVEPWAGMFVKKADPKIIETLKESGKLYRSETVHHTYPFCWRCKTPLIYYAKPSWYFKTSAVNAEMAAANSKVHWEPEHIRDGRFGEWLKQGKDWAITRERYWGTPLPIWRCEEKHVLVVGSSEELEKRRFKKPNTFLFIRHGEATNNEADILASGEEANKYHLTEKGKKQVGVAAKKIAKKKPVAIFSSPVTRTKETAELIGEATGLPVVFDDRLREIELGVLNGKPAAEYRASFHNADVNGWDRGPEGGETWKQVRTRMMSFLKEVDAKHEDETIVVVTHGLPIFLTDITVNGIKESEQFSRSYPKNTNITEVSLPNWPFNDEGALDVHRPYIDEITLKCPDCKKEMRRIKDVIDVWFDSGSMPFAQWHYPFENKERIDKNVSFPADYIAEAIDQTRGWFYTLLAVHSLLGHKEAPYKNVVCLSHILDSKGKKMSKSKGNIVSPWDMFEKYGADATRFYLYTANQPGDYKRFDEKDVDGVVKKVFLILWNVVEFWKLTRSSKLEAEISSGEHILDAWLRARTHQLVETVTTSLDGYKVTEAGRAIAEFVNDLSTWYIRRSRERLRSGGGSAALEEALRTTALLMAPFTPFIAEQLYAELGGKGESVHLDAWPVLEKKNENADLIGRMETVRKIVEMGHALRDEAGLKLRQPLGEVEIERGSVKNIDELLPIIAEELNVKEVKLMDKIDEREMWLIKNANSITVALNTELTETLKREGWMREIFRQINDLRKEAKLTVSDTITLYLETTDAELASYLVTERDAVLEAARATELIATRAEVANFREIALDGKKLWIGIRK